MAQKLRPRMEEILRNLGQGRVLEQVWGFGGELRYDPYFPDRKSRPHGRTLTALVNRGLVEKVYPATDSKYYKGRHWYVAAVYRLTEEGECVAEGLQ